MQIAHLWLGRRLERGRRRSLHRAQSALVCLQRLNGSFSNSKLVVESSTTVRRGLPYAFQDTLSLSRWSLPHRKRRKLETSRCFFFFKKGNADRNCWVGRSSETAKTCVAVRAMACAWDSSTANLFANQFNARFAAPLFAPSSRLSAIFSTERERDREHRPFQDILSLSFSRGRRPRQRRRRQ